jgi:hypothetical protein
MLMLAALLLLQPPPPPAGPDATTPGWQEPSDYGDPFYQDHRQHQQDYMAARMERSQDRGLLVEFYRTDILRAWDRNNDDMLSETEWAAMVARGYPAADSRRHRREPAARAFYLSLHRAFDRNDDGEVTFAELTREPLITFDCLDANHDRIVTQSEVSRRAAICPSRNSARPGFVAARLAR